MSSQSQNIIYPSQIGPRFSLLTHVLHPCTNASSLAVLVQQKTENVKPVKEIALCSTSAVVFQYLITVLFDGTGTGKAVDSNIGFLVLVSYFNFNFYCWPVGIFGQQFFQTSDTEKWIYFSDPTRLG